MEVAGGLAGSKMASRMSNTRWCDLTRGSVASQGSWHAVARLAAGTGSYLTHLRDGHFDAQFLERGLKLAPVELHVARSVKLRKDGMKLVQSQAALLCGARGGEQGVAGDVTEGFEEE